TQPGPEVTLNGIPTPPGRLMRFSPSQEFYRRSAGRVTSQSVSLLIEAMAACLDQADDHEDSAARRRHQLIMRQFHRFLEKNPETVLYLPEICARIGVSARTLLMCCHEYLGMGPKRYLLLRHMHLVRRALQTATPDTATVTGILTRHGVWQFGRCAGRYKL